MFIYWPGLAAAGQGWTTPDNLRCRARLAVDRDEVAARLRVSRRTVRRLEKTGHLTVIHVSERSPRITEASVEAHIAKHTA